MTVEQAMKKLNSMKTKVEVATYLKRTGNKEIVLTDCHKKFYTLWNNEEVQEENTVLNRAQVSCLSSVISLVIHVATINVIGAVTAGYAMGSTCKSSTSTLLSPSEMKKTLQLTQIIEPEEYQGYSLQHLHIMCSIQQMQVARAQERAAIQMKEHYQLKINQENSIILNTEPLTDINNCRE
ncbi:hypothetical protein JTB14_002933 [Gonioctena quinquepunctata]|nr:hypothetical protein JTB14_002933 [Gonioctena quinquepunctata]